MSRLIDPRTSRFVLAAVAVALIGFLTPKAIAQSSELQQKVTEIKQALARNQQALSQYTWQMQQTVSVKGDVKSSELFQEQLGPNGQTVKVPITATPSPSGRRFGIRHRITEEYQTYGKQIAALAQSYAQPDPGKLQQLYSQGNVSVKSGGAPGMVALVVSNYVKQGDAVTLSFNQAQKSLVGINIATYNSDPSDVVTITVQFAKLPDGTNHVSNATVNGQSMNMVVQQQNMNYLKRGS